MLYEVITVASGTDIDLQIATGGGSGSKTVAAGARDFNFLVLGVNTGFHGFDLLRFCYQRGLNEYSAALGRVV